MKTSKARVSLTIGETLVLKIPKILNKFLAKPKDYTLEEAVEDYVAVKPLKSKLEAIYLKQTTLFKDSGQDVIKGKYHSLVAKRTGSSRFDKERFIQDYGPGVYEKYTKNCPTTEYIVVDNSTIEASIISEE